MAAKDFKEFMEMYSKDKEEREEREREKKEKREREKTEEREVREREKAEERAVREREKVAEWKMREKEREVEKGERGEFLKTIVEKVEGIGENVRKESERCQAKQSELEQGLVEIQETFSRLETEAASVENNNQEKFKKIETRIQKVEKQVSKGVGTTTRIVYVREDGERKRVEFWGNFKERPMVFLREVEKLIEEIDPSMSDQDELGIAERNLQGNAKEWWSVVKEGKSSYKEFRKLFIERYWSFQVQSRVRNEIESGRYNENGAMCKTDYFCRLMNKASDLDPAIPTEYLLNSAFQHFRREIQIASLGKPRESVQDAIAFLLNVDAMEGQNRQTGSQPFVRRQEPPRQNLSPTYNYHDRRSYGRYPEKSPPQNPNNPGPSKHIPEREPPKN